MKRAGTLLLTLILSGFSTLRCGATVYNSNGSAASVQSIHNNQVQNGDTITLPAGAFTWSRGVQITKAITLQGAGVGQTIIKDAVQSGQLIQWTLAPGQRSRITGIKFQDGGRINRVNAPSGILHVDGSNTDGSTFRFDHCKWNNLNGETVFDTVVGVIDHNTFVLDRFSPALYVYGSHWNGRDHGDGSWAAPTGYGSSQWLFIEDNNFTHSQAKNLGVTDAYAGARYVFRHNTIYSGIVGNHGTESTGRARGCRAMEIYSNRYTGGNFNKFVSNTRSGGVLFHDNSISGYWGDSAQFNLQNYRNYHPFNPWGGADGTNAWDVNEPNAFFTGTAAANSTSQFTVKVSGANWTANRWRGYCIRRTSDVCNSGSNSYSVIRRNTSNTITYMNNAGYGKSSMSFCTGDSFEIRKVDHALDQPGRALGSLITEDTPVRPSGWNNQVTEPCYSWNNTNEVNGRVNFRAGPEIRANEHYFNDTPMPGYRAYVYPHPLVTGAGGADFNGDGSSDFVLQNASTSQTAVWYMDNNIRINSASGPTLWAGWNVAGVADFNLDGHPDYLLFSPSTGQTWVWYMDNNTRINNASGPALWAGWNVAGVADFNLDGHPDYLLFNPTTGETAIWYLNNNVLIGHADGPTLWGGWNVAGVADFNNDGHPDYLLFSPSTGQTWVWYMDNNTRINNASGPALWAGWNVAGVADFNLDGHPDYLLFNPTTGETAIWYLNNNVLIGHADGPTLSSGWSLVAP